MSHRIKISLQGSQAKARICRSFIENMNKYYEVTTHETSKPLFSKDNYSTFNVSKEQYKTLQEAKDELKEKYGGVKKVKMFRDKKDGESFQAGWIYCFKNRDISHNSNWWLQQDWVEIREITSNTIL